MRSAIALVVLLGSLVGCTDDKYIIVTVQRRPTVHGATKLKVTLSNSGSMRTDDLDLKGKDFPVTFSLTAPGRGGELGISIDAFDTNDSLVGRGAGQATLTDTMAAVTLDSADFVVNTDYAGNQFLTSDFEAVGLQISSITNGTWMPVFRDDCTGTPAACDIYGRRFDSAGQPVQSVLAAGTNQFKITTTLTAPSAMPAVASSGVSSVVLWDFQDTVGAGTGIACRSINEMGAGNPAQLSITTEAADVVTAAPVGNGNFAVTWQLFDSTAGHEMIHATIINSDCQHPGTLSPNPIAISVGPTTLGHRRSHVAANGNGLMYVWTADGEVRAHQGLLTGAITGNEIKPVMKTASLEVDHVRIVPFGTGYVLGVRWAATDNTSPGKIEVYRLDATGNVVGTPTLITDKSGSDFASDKGFGMAARSDGALLVVWHNCPNGPGSCDVFGRILRPSLVPVGDEFMIPTATGGDQVNPSVVAVDNMSFVAAWNDSSQLDPDKSMSAVRARIIYPAYDDARAVLGATCGASAPGAPNCGAGLLCASGTDSVQRCYEECSGQCPHGGTCSAADGGMACTF